MGDLAELRHELPRMLADLEPVQHAAGMFGKVTALDQVTQDLGADRKMSGKPVALGAGYDIGNPVVINLRPGGLWHLADKGRKRSGPIRPKRRRRGRNGRPTAVLVGTTGFRASSSYGPSRGLNTIRDTEQAIVEGIDQAVADGVTDMLRKGGWL